MYKNNILLLEEKIGYIFRNKDNALIAITHPSSNKSKNLGKRYQRFEFLGDAVLKNSIAMEIFGRYPDINESQLSVILSDLVSRKKCFDIGFSIGLSEYIIVSKGELLSGGNFKKNILSDTLEAIIGAIYFDSNDFYITDKVIKFLWKDSLNSDILIEESERNIIQNYSLKKYKKLPIYEVHEDKAQGLFIAKLLLENSITEGSGINKKDAKKNAAKKMIKLLKL